MDFANWDLPAAKANVGQEIEVERGAVALAPSGDRDGGTVVLKEKAKVILRDLATVEVQRGVVAIEGPVKAQTRNATVKPSGTVYVVEVTDSGETVVSTFDGEVVAESTRGDSHTLSAGQQVQVASDGTMGPVTTFDVLVAEKEVLPTQDLAMPFELEPLEDQGTATVKPFGLGDNRILLFAGSLSGVLFALGAIGTGIAIMLPGGRDPTLAVLVAQGKALRRQVQAGQVHPAQVQPLTGRDSQGRLWSLHPLQRQWQVWNGAAGQPARLPPGRQGGCGGAGGTVGALGLLGLLVVAPLAILAGRATPQPPVGATAVAVELSTTSPPGPTIVQETVVPVTAGPDAVPTLTTTSSPRPTPTDTPKPTDTVTAQAVSPVASATTGPDATPTRTVTPSPWPTDTPKPTDTVTAQAVSATAPGPTAEYDLYVKRLDYLPAGSDLVTGQPVQFNLMIVADIFPQQGPLFPASHFRWRPGSDLDWREGECPADTHYATCTASFEFTYVEPGRYDVEVEVDTRDEVSETDEADNTLRLTLEVLQEPASQLSPSTAEVTPAQIDAETARTLMPSAPELGIASLPSLQTTTFEVAGYGEVTAFEFVDQSSMVSLMVFDTVADAAGFVEEQRSLYHTLGDTLAPAQLGDEGFVRDMGEGQTEILVRVDRYTLGTLGGATPEQIRPAVERMAAFVSD
ncbi:MAG: hypothetical protein H8E35_05985 [Ardenticatenia bacterium]|nr:hypothetical protein [Ardenticatenia bacterium]